MLKTLPKVSIIIPVYNFERFIASTLESAFNQTYENLEIIVVNDGSSDNSAEIVADLQKSHKNLILINQENAGVSAARNRGMQEATGEYFCFSDADDLLTPDYVSYLVGNALQYNAEVSLSTGIFTNYKVGNVSANDNSEDNIRVIGNHDAIIKMLTYWYPIGCYCRAFHRSLYEKGLRFIPGQKVGEGFTFNIKSLLLADKIVEGKKAIYCYRKDNDKSCMTEFNIDRARNAVESIGIIRSLFNNPSSDIQDALDFAEWHTKGDMYNWMLISGNGKKYPEERKDYYNSIKKFSKKAGSLKLNRRERLKTILMRIHPSLIAKLLILRKKI